MTPFWDKRVAVWVSQRISPTDRGFGKCQALGVMHRGDLVAGVVFHNWEPEAGTIELSAAAAHRGWMTRSVINEVFGYVFGGLGAQMATARTRADNAAVRRIWKALGASEVIIPRMFGRTENGAVLTLTDDRWRSSKFYQGGRHGQQEQCA